MTVVDFHKIEENMNVKLKYVVIMAEFQEKWVLVRHKDRDTWEIPGGHIEEGEKHITAAKRELFEETGALEYEISPICLYSVKKDNKSSYGVLYYASVNKIDDILKYEIIDRKLVSKIEGNLTYPDIQPILAKMVEKYISQQKN